MYNQNFTAQREIVSQIMAIQEYKNYTQEQRDKILLKRISRFYDSNDHIDVSQEHYKPKLQPPNIADDYTANDTLILFGTDFMSSSTIKQRFKVNDAQFSFEKIDASNCILRFSSSLYARQAILFNFKKNSPTAFKVEQINEEPLQEVNPTQGQNVQHLHQTAIPKQWIQLQPYIYRHYYRSQKHCPHMYQEYTRKLYIRYATYHQKSAVKVSFQSIQQLYRKCEQVWRAEAQRNNQLKKVLYLKLKQFKQRKDILERKLKQSQVIDGIIENSNVHYYMQRSRSRQARFRRDCSNQFETKKRHLQTKNKVDFQMNLQTDYQKKQKQHKQKFMHQKQQNQILQFTQLINEIKGVTLRLESVSNHSQAEEDNRHEVNELCNQLNNLNFSKLRAQYIPIPYSLAKPTQLRLNNSRKSRFKYHQYIKKNEEIQNKVLKFSEIDLTLQ